MATDAADGRDRYPNRRSDPTAVAKGLDDKRGFERDTYDALIRELNAESSMLRRSGRAQITKALWNWKCAAFRTGSRRDKVSRRVEK